eukprot:UN12444
MDSKTKIKNKIITSKSAKKYKINQSIPNKLPNMTQIPTNIAALPETNVMNHFTTSFIQLQQDEKRKYKKKSFLTNNTKKQIKTSPSDASISDTNMPNNYHASAFNGIYGSYTNHFSGSIAKKLVKKKKREMKKDENKLTLD